MRVDYNLVTLISVGYKLQSLNLLLLVCIISPELLDGFLQRFFISSMEPSLRGDYNLVTLIQSSRSF